MSSVDVFEEVRKGALTTEQGAKLLSKQREAERRPSKPRWLPRPVYFVILILLTIFIPSLATARSS